MGLILGVIVIIIGILASMFIVKANGMSDAPSQNSISIFPWLIGCSLLGGILIITHYFPVHW